MMARLQPFRHYRKTEALNAMREAVAEWKEIGTVHMALSTAGGSLNRQNELLRIDSTHTAATWDRVEPGDRLRGLGADGGTGYEVTYVIDGGRRRMHQLFLKREDEPPEREAT